MRDPQVIKAKLLGWYDRHARILPWRTPPGHGRSDPYRVWLSEVMLQQTTVAAVKAYFERFTSLWPTVQDRAAAEDAQVMAEWAWLGYYSRARNLIACARAVAQRGGVFPDTEEALRALPGLGAYTAAAVAAIAFGRRAAVVDANVERVVTRPEALEEPLPQARPRIRQRVAEFTPPDRPGDFAQAMMDLGATVCTARSPRCLLCPLAQGCKGRVAGAERFPVKPAKKPKPERKGRAFWIERDGAVWLVTRPDKGMLGGMRALPDDGWNARADGAAPPPLEGAWQAGGSVRHTFTHFHLVLRVFAAEADGPGFTPRARFRPADLPTVMRKVWDAAQSAFMSQPG